jgi:CBS domain-containing protein
MKTKLVKDLMVPVSGYATVSQEATLYEAITALEEAQKKFDPSRYRHRAILIYDENQKIVGKVSHLDVLRALEPKYEKIGDTVSLSRFGFSPHFLKTMQDQLRLWDKPMNHICKKAAQLKVKTFMYTPTEGEFVDENASLDEAINQFIMGHHQSLLVTRDKEIVGILRLTDVFNEICQAIKTCEIQTK